MPSLDFGNDYLSALSTGTGTLNIDLEDIAIADNHSVATGKLSRLQNGEIFIEAEFPHHVKIRNEDLRLPPNDGQLLDTKHKWLLKARTIDGWDVAGDIDPLTFRGTHVKLSVKRVILSKKSNVVSSRIVFVFAGIRGFPWERQTPNMESHEGVKSNEPILESFMVEVDHVKFRMMCVNYHITLSEVPCPGNYSKEQILQSFFPALSFCLGRHVWPHAEFYADGNVQKIELRRPWELTGSYEYRPIEDLAKHKEDTRRLLVAAVGHLLNSEQDSRQGVQYAILFPLYVENADISLQALVFCLLVESLVALLQAGHSSDMAGQCFSEEEIKEITKAVERSFPENNSAKRKRIRGCLQSLLNPPRPQDTLRAISDSRWFPISKDEITAWEKVRHVLAHGNFDKWPKQNNQGLQGQVDAVSILAVLVNKIILYLIGYQGQYTDYGKRGYPDKDFVITKEHVSL